MYKISLFTSILIELANYILNFIFLIIYAFYDNKLLITNIFYYLLLIRFCYSAYYLVKNHKNFYKLIFIIVLLLIL